VNSSASKAGKKVIYKKDHTALLKQIISMSGDYTRASEFKPTKSTDVSDTKYEQMEEISSRMGGQIYGYMKPDNEHVKEEVKKKSVGLNWRREFEQYGIRRWWSRSISSRFWRAKVPEWSQTSGHLTTQRKTVL
jgi:hypothetical protein